MEQSIGLIAFDLDGTLVDSTAGIVTTINRVLEHFAQPVAPVATVTAMIGLPLEEFWQTFAPAASADWADYTALYRELYRRDGIPAIQPFPDTVATLNWLRQAGYRLSIASSKITSVSRLVLEQTNLLAAFDLLMGNDTVTQPKPHGEMLHRTLDHFGLRTDQAILVGDTTHDIALGNNAGVRTVIVAQGAHSREVLSAARPAALLDSLAQLPDWLAQQTA